MNDTERQQNHVKHEVSEGKHERLGVSCSAAVRMHFVWQRLDSNQPYAAQFGRRGGNVEEKVLQSIGVQAKFPAHGEPG